MLRKLSRTMATVVALSALVMVSQAGAASPKLVVKGADGTTTKFVVNDDGTIGAGVASTIYPFEMTSDNAGSVPAGTGAFMMQGSANKERFEVRSAGVVYGQGPTFQGKGGGGSMTSPSATLFDHVLFALGGSGYNGSSWVIPNAALVKIKATDTWTATSNPTMISFETTKVGSANGARTEFLAITPALAPISPDTNRVIFPGVIVSNGPLKITGGSGNTLSCDKYSRGSIWLNQGASVDTMQICLQTAAGVYAWKSITAE